jgi:hypothetical protein
MNTERQFSLTAVVAVACWSATLLLLVCAWGAWMLDAHAHLAILIAETACVLSAVAAVMQIRCFSAQVCSQIRVLRVEQQHSRPPERSGVRGV